MFSDRLTELESKIRAKITDKTQPKDFHRDLKLSSQKSRANKVKSKKVNLKNSWLSIH